ncbi:lysophospholipid acyltransferase family protein [Actinomycetota bacterium]
MWYWVFKFAIIGPIARVLLAPRWSGREHLPRRGPFVLAPNHNTYLDPVFVSLGVPRKVIFIAKSRYYEHRLLGWFLSAIGQIPVDPENAASAAPALDAARGLLASGGVWAAFPEGTRSPDGRLYRGHTGIMRVALAANATVIPVAVAGTREINPPESLGRSRIHVTYGRPMDLSPWAGRADDPEAWREATDDLMREIAAMSGQEQVDAYPPRKEGQA